MDAGKTSHYTSPFQVADILLGVKPWWNFPEVGGCSIHLPDMPPVGWVPFVLEGLGSDVYPRARGQRGSLFGDGERPQRVGWMVECLFRQGVGTISKTWLGYWKMGNRMVCLSFQACFFFVDVWGVTFITRPWSKGEWILKWLVCHSSHGNRRSRRKKTSSHTSHATTFPGRHSNVIM